MAVNIVSTSLYTMKEVYSLLSFYKLEHLLSFNGDEIRIEQVFSSLKKHNIISELIAMINGGKPCTVLEAANVVKAFLFRASKRWEDALQIFDAIPETKNRISKKISTSNVYLDFCNNLCKIGNFNPKDYGVDEYAYILYCYNLEKQYEEKLYEGK